MPRNESCRSGSAETQQAPARAVVAEREHGLAAWMLLSRALEATAPEESRSARERAELLSVDDLTVTIEGD